jgi:hypothetical protein
MTPKEQADKLVKVYANLLKADIFLPEKYECCTPKGQVQRYVHCVGCDKKPIENSLEKKLYTEDEVLDLLVKMNSWPTTFEGKEDITEWFEQGQYY